MSSNPSDHNPSGAYPPPAGASQPGAPGGQAPPPGAPGQQGYPYPPPGGYAPPPGQPGYYPQYYTPPPPGQYPYAYPGYYPPPGQYGQPPPGQWGAPPPGQYPPLGAPPPGTSGAPGSPGAAAAPGGGHHTSSTPAGTPGQHPPAAGSPPAGQYPPPQGQYAVYAPAPVPAGQQVPYGASPFGAPMPGYPGAPAYYPPPSPSFQDPLVYLGTAIPDPAMPPAALGVEKVPGYDPAHDYNAILRATAHDSTNESQLLKVLPPLNVFQMDALNDYCTGKEGVSLTDKIERKTTANFGLALRALTLGPLGYDVDLARKALVGIGTNEMLLTELILGRPGHEIRWLKTGYRLKYGKDLVEAVKGDLSGKSERMFIMALNTQKPVDSPYTPIDHTRVAADIETLHNASKKKDEIPFFEILINRSDGHLAAVIVGFGQRYKSLSKVIKKTFSGIIESALLYIVHGVKPKRDQQGFWRDAKLLERSMAGLGTKDQQLIYRLVRAHWNPQRMEAIKDAYKRRYGKTLEHRVKGETSGPYKDLLVAILNKSAEQPPPIGK